MRIALIIVLGASYYLGWLPAWLVVPALLAVSVLRTAGPTRRPGGSAPQLSGAFNGGSPTTAERVATYTSSPVNRGDWPEVRTTFMPLADLSKTFEPGSSTAPTAVTNPGEHTTAAAEKITVTEGEHVFTVYPNLRDCGCNDAA